MLNRTSVERSSDRELTITRTFNAPPRIVFDAWTSAELVKRWWAPVSLGVSIVSCEADVRVGGRYRYVLKPATSEAFAFSGTYREVTPYSRLVYTTFFEPGLAPPKDESEARSSPSPSRERDGPTSSHASCIRRRKCWTARLRPAWRSACARRWTCSTSWWSRFADRLVDGGRRAPVSRHWFLPSDGLRMTA